MDANEIRRSLKSAVGAWQMFSILDIIILTFERKTKKNLSANE